MTSIGANAFYGCFSLASASFVVASELAIGQQAFGNCYTINQVPVGTTLIGSNTYQYCHRLTQITIPSTVASISGGAFLSCRSLQAIYLKSSVPPSLNALTAFSNIYSLYSIYIPYSEDHSVLAAYQTATNWSAYASNMVEYTVE